MGCLLGGLLLVVEVLLGLLGGVGVWGVVVVGGVAGGEGEGLGGGRWVP